MYFESIRDSTVMFPTFITGEEYECEFCSLECRTRSEWNKHIIQHFKQRECEDCGKTMIRVGDVWYGPHTSQVCSQNITTEMSADIENTEEIILPDFIEVKSEEIYDVIDESDGDGDDIDNEMDNVIDNGMENDDDNDDVAANIKKHPSRDEEQPYSLKQLKKGTKLEVGHGSTTQYVSLTEDQLKNRVCPICNKLIVNKQNLICHMNIHNGIKPFSCPVCKKSFNHVRNMVRHVVRIFISILIKLCQSFHMESYKNVTNSCCFLN